MLLNNVLHRILFKKHDLCSLCFKPVCENAINTQDEIAFESKNTLHNRIKVTDILRYVLGDEFDMMFDTICEECLKLAKDSYIFVTMCKGNLHCLYNSLESLSKSLPKLQHTVDELKNCKTLFVSLNTMDFKSQLYYDSKRPVVTRAAAYKRFQNVITTKKVAPELDSNESKIKKNSTKASKVDGNYDTKETVRRQIKPNRLHTHNMMYDKNDMTNIKCKVCLKKCHSLNDLRQHYIRVHAPKNFKCPECNRCYGSAYFLERHRYESHCTVVCSQCGKTFHNRHTLKMHELGHKFRLVCQSCGRIYKNKDTFRNHIELKICGQTKRRSPSQGQFTCDTCNKKFSQKCTLRVHIKFEHGDGKAHVCDWCNKKFTCVSKLKAHIVKHTHEKKFGCDFCGGKFVTKESLLYHTRLHTGEKPYQCDFCSLKFLSASRRAEHVKRHHKNSVFDDKECDHKRTQMCLQNHVSKHNSNSMIICTLQLSDDKALLT